MKKFFVLLLLISLTGQAAFAQAEAPAEDDSMGITVSLDHWSKYIWRGMYYFGTEGAFFPALSYDFMKTGLVLNVSGELSDAWVLDGEVATVNKDFQALDLGVDYSYTIDETVTVGASFWYYRMSNNAYSFANTIAFVTFEGFLSPTLTFTHDYYFETKKKEDFYVQLGISHELEVNKEAKVGFGLVGGYYNFKSGDKAGISDITASVSPSIAIGNASVYATLNVIFVPSEDYYMVGTVEDKLRYYTVFGSSYSL